MAALQAAQRCSSTRAAPPARSSADGAAMAAIAVLSLPQQPQGGLSTCAGHRLRLPPPAQLSAG